MKMKNTHKCRYGCGKVLVYDQECGKPPFYEEDTGIHHTYKRCADLIGPDASTRFSEYKKRRYLDVKREDDIIGL
jgi:hypothetical protein